MRWTTPLLLCAVLAAPAFAGPDEAKEKPACDASCIDWVFPGHFEDALNRAKEQNRILIIKGVSFGIDEVGATCATKGTW